MQLCIEQSFHQMMTEIRHSLGAEALLSLTQSTPSVLYNTTKLIIITRIAITIILHHDDRLYLPFLALVSKSFELKG